MKSSNDYPEGNMQRQRSGFELVPEGLLETLLSHGIDSTEKLNALFEPNLYAVIPVAVLERTDISANAKLLYAEINALSKKSGVCFATNDFLASRIGASVRTVSRDVQSLEEARLIRSEISKSKKGTYRNIFVLWSAGGVDNLASGGSQVVVGGVPILASQKRSKQIEVDKENSARAEDLFSEFWKAYPRKTAKHLALKKFVSLRPTPELVEKMIASIEAHKKTRQWQESSRFIPHAATFLNQRRWEDEVEAAPVTSKKTIRV